MVNWKTKYLEMKLKYINAKQKAGAINTTARQFDLMILDALEETYPNIRSIDINGTDINDLIEYGFEIKISKKPINYSLALIKKVLHNTITDTFYVLNEVIQTGDEDTPVKLTLQLVNEYDYDTDKAISLKDDIIIITDLSGLVFYPTKENIVKAINSAQ
jgi:hypothetical protein